MRVPSLDSEDPLEKGMATHSSILAWRVPRTEEPGGLTVHGVAKNWIRLSNLERCWKARWWKWLGNLIIGSEGTSPADSASCLSSFPASSSLSQTACWARSYCEKNFCKERVQVTLPKPWEKYCHLLELRNLGLSWEHRVPVGRGMQVCVYTLSGCGNLPVGVGTPCLG